MLKAIILGLLMLSAGTMGLAAWQQPADVFPITFWWPPPPEETTDERYKEIAECNFTLALCGNSGGDYETNIKRLTAAGTTA